MINKIWRYLRSFELGIILMCLLALLCLVVAFIPQEEIAKASQYGRWRADNPAISSLLERVGLTSLFTSIVFYAILALMVVNLGLCCVYKVRGLLEAKMSLRSAKWGSLFFHSCLAFIFLCGFYSRLTRFEGYIELGEGQSFVEEHSSYLNVSEGPFFGERHRNFALTLERINAFTDYKVREKDYKSDLTVRAKDGSQEMRASIEVNAPLIYDGFIIYQTRYFGKSLLLRYKDGKGGESTGFVNLSLPQREGGEPVVDFGVPGTKAHVKGILHKPSSPPSMTLTISEGEAKTFEGRIPIGEEIKVAGGTLSVLDVKGWSGLLVVRDASVVPIFIGFVMGMVGLIWMFRGR